MIWDGIVRLPGASLGSLRARLGGRLVGGDASSVARRLAPVARAAAGDLAPVLSSRWLRAAAEASGRGATLLVAESLAARVPPGAPAWVHPHADWAMAELLDDADVPDVPPAVDASCRVAPSAVLGPRVVLGARVFVGAGAVIGHPGFGWTTDPSGAVRAVPQLGGVVIEDDVWIGPLCTIDAGTLAPTRLRRGVKLDAHVHVGHNGDVGEGTMIAAQCGLAGSVTLGAGVLVGGQVGIADHVTVGAGARIAAKSGVIGDVPPGAVVAGYPAVARSRWLRGLATLYRGARRGSERAAASSVERPEELP